MHEICDLVWLIERFIMHAKERKGRGVIINRTFSLSLTRLTVINILLPVIFE
jgi:hypothetical protein